MQNLMQRLSNPNKNDYDLFPTGPDSRKTEIFDPTRQSNSCIGKVRKLSRMLGWLVLIRCSHINSQYNAVHGRRTGSNNSGVEEIPR